MLERVRDYLKRNRAHESNQVPESPDSLIKLVSIYYNLAKKQPNLPVIPQFLTQEANLSNLTQRVTTSGLTKEES